MRAGRFRLLLTTLIVYCFTIAARPEPGVLFPALVVALLAVTVYELHDDERGVIKRTVLVMGVLLAAARISDFLAPSAGLPQLANMLDVLFAFGVTYAVHSAVRRPHRPAVDRVIGAICVYLLIGLAWASIYSTIETSAPGSFRFPDDTPYDPSGRGFVYFSFVTLATIGYGDVTPVSRLAGTFAWMEAITGQLYIAITIAGLISLALTEKQAPE
jgi:voltage-gated potassium channel